MALNQVTKAVRGFPDWHLTRAQDFQEWVAEVSGQTETTIFRSQKRDWPLLPSICRNRNDKVLLRQERESITQFVEEAPPTLQEIPASDWDWLVVAQHYGLPTRLLDWTSDPFTALWFALRDLADENDRPEVWVMNPLKEDVIEDLQGTRPFAGARTKAFQSKFNHPRVRAQNSWFTATKFIEKGSMGFIPIGRNWQLRKRVQRVRISQQAWDELNRSLESQGYTETKMYPSTETVAARIRHRVFNGGA